MKKADIDARMADYLEGDLPLEDRALFDAFLDANADSAREVAELRRTIALLRSLPDPEMPPYLASHVMARIRTGEADLPWWRRLVSGLSEWASNQWAVPLAAAATVAALVFLNGDLRLIQTATEAVPAATEVRPEAVASRVGAERTPESAFGRRDLTEEASLREVRNRRPSPVERQLVLQRNNPLDLLLLGAETGQRHTFGSRSPVIALPVADDRGSRPAGTLSPTGIGAASGESPTLVEGPLSASAYDEGAARIGSSEAQRNARLNDFFAALFQDPDALVFYLAQSSVAERELWGKNLAQRAVELDVVDRVLDAMNSDPRLNGGDFARAFSSEVGHLKADVVASENSTEAQPAPPPPDDAAGR